MEKLTRVIDGTSDIGKCCICFELRESTSCDRCNAGYCIECFLKLQTQDSIKDKCIDCSICKHKIPFDMFKKLE